MSHSGWSAANYISAVGGSPPTGYPYTLVGRVNPNSTSSGTICTLFLDATHRVQIATANPGTLRASMQVNDAGGNTATSSTTVLSTGTWYSIIGVFRSATDRELYLNGVSEATSTTSRNPSAFTGVRIGLNGAGAAQARGSVGVVGIYNVALSLEDVQALGLHQVHPLLVRRDALTNCIDLLDSGTLDLVAPAATVTGTLTKDNDHPRVILPRQRSLIIPKGAGGGGATTHSIELSPASFAYTPASLEVPVTRALELSPASFAFTANALSVPVTRSLELSAASFSFTANDLTADYVPGNAPVTYSITLNPVSFSYTPVDLAVSATIQASTTDTHDGIGYGDPFRRKRRPKKGKREKAVEDLLKKLMGLVPDDPPPAIEAEAEIAQASVERLFAPTVDVTPNLEALQFAQLQLAKLEAMLNRYLEDEDDEDDLLLMAA